MTRSADVMTEVQNGGDASVSVFELEQWRAAYGVVAGITSAAGGFDLGLASSEPVRQVMARWGSFLGYHRPGFFGTVVRLQPHGSAVCVHRIGSEGMTVQSGLDGHVTDVRGVLLGVTVANLCPPEATQPELFGDPVGERERALDRVLDDVHGKYGDMLRRGASRRRHRD